MLSKLRSRLTYANVVSSVCLFILLGGTAFAAARVITGKEVKNGTLSGKDVRNSSLTGLDVKNESLSPADFNGSVEGPKGDTGARGPKGETGTVDTSNFYDKGQTDARVRSNVFFRDPGQHAFTLPAGVTGVLAELRGGGGGGSGAVICGGGGQGAFGRVYIPATAGQTWTVTVGGGGPAGINLNDGQAGGLSRLANSGTELVTASGGGGGTCVAGGAGGDPGLTDHMVAVETAKGANGVTGSGGAPNAGGGQPGYFGSGSQSNANNVPGSGGYVMLHLMR